MTKPSRDTTILKKLSANVDYFYGPRKNLTYVLKVNTVRGVLSQRHERDSFQYVSRTFAEFQSFRKSLLARVGGGNSFRVLTHKCNCSGVESGSISGGCPFDVMRTFLERVRFTPTSLFKSTLDEEDVVNRNEELNSFLQILFAILNRMNARSWHSDCFFLEDIMNFLDVKESFCEQIESLIRVKGRQMNLIGWKTYTEETFGVGIRS